MTSDFQFSIRNPQSAIPNPQSAIRNPQSAIPNPQSPISRGVFQRIPRLWARVSPRAIRRNLAAIRSRLPRKTALAAVVKSDAYGHGMQLAARVAASEGCAFLAVISVEEAAALRDVGFDCGILVIGPIEPWQATEAVALDLGVFTGNLEVAQALDDAAREQNTRARVHLKIDTGMGRFGFQDAPEEFGPALDRLLQLSHLNLEGAATHFTMADEPQSECTREQTRRFRLVLRMLEARGVRPRWIHAANSGTIVHFPNTAFSLIQTGLVMYDDADPGPYPLVRAGLAMYGVYPGPEPEAALELEPAMTLGCRIADIRGVPTGFSVSYAGTFKTTRPSRLAVLPVGYGCGYPRHASGKAEAIIRGRRAPLAGRITMNITVADVTDVPEARVGDTALLFGREGSDLLRVEEVARAAGTIPYEVLCNVGRCTPRLLEED